MNRKQKLNKLVQRTLVSIGDIGVTEAHLWELIELEERKQAKGKDDKTIRLPEAVSS